MEVAIKINDSVHHYKFIGELLFINKYANILSNGVPIKNLYITNNTFGNIIIYEFLEVDKDQNTLDKFHFIENTVDGFSIVGSQFAVMDALISGSMVYILTEGGDIFYCDIDSPEELRHYGNPISHIAPLDTERGKAFYFDESISDMVIASNMRTLYPFSDIKFLVNVENPIFVSRNVLASDISRIVINTESGMPIQGIDYVEAASRGLLLGTKKVGNESKTISIINGVTETVDFLFSNALQIDSNIFLFYDTNSESQIADFKVITSNNSNNTNSAEDVILGQF